jgi:uncharacterized metal-binding protein YceD (DUF177 family)
MTIPPEFSRLIAIEGITPDKVRKETITASAAECEALARRFDLRGLSEFKARISLRRVTGGPALRVQGDFEAEVVQTCVVSLQDVHAHVQGHFDTFFSEETAAPAAEIALDDDETSPEIITNGVIDMGEIVAQYLSLELDPYPRAPGVSLAAQLAEIGAEVKNSPFRVLEGLKGEKPEGKKPGAKKTGAVKAAAAKIKPATKPGKKTSKQSTGAKAGGTKRGKKDK